MSAFSKRHIGPNEAEKATMLAKIGVHSVAELIDKTIPAHIRLNRELHVSDAMSEQEYLNHVNNLANKNKVFKSFIGLGYNETIVPSVILRNVLENPGWYTAYTPYQAEISQGRLEALLNFQTMILDLTGMEIANASLLDEGTAASEAMIMFFNSRSRADVQAGKNKFFVAEDSLPQSIDVMLGRALNLGIELVVGNIDAFEGSSEYFGAFIQNPCANGHVRDLTSHIGRLKSQGIQVAVAADILSLVLLKSPGSMGADVVLGSSQRFGVPMGFGGPHAAYFATKDAFKRGMPGRLIGVSIDAQGNPVLLQLGENGEAVQTKMPDGVTLSKEPIKLDAGTHFVLLDPITRQSVGVIPKDVAGEAAQQALGKEQGSAQAAVPAAKITAEQTIAKIDELLSDPNLGGISGWQAWLPDSGVAAVSGSGALGLRRLVGRVKLAPALPTVKDAALGSCHAANMESHHSPRPRSA